MQRISNESSMTQDNSIVIREYLTTDKEVVMNLIKLNTPNHFPVNEQGKSLGKKLLRYRIEVLKAIPSIKKITVRTSQLAYKFYEKQGFTLNEIKRNYWADGFDMYSMQYNEL